MDDRVEVHGKGGREPAEEKIRQWLSGCSDDVVVGFPEMKLALAAFPRLSSDMLEDAVIGRITSLSSKSRSFLSNLSEFSVFSESLGMPNEMLWRVESAASERCHELGFGMPVDERFLRRMSISSGKTVVWLYEMMKPSMSDIPEEIAFGILASSFHERNGTVWNSIAEQLPGLPVWDEVSSYMSSTMTNSRRLVNRLGGR